MVFVYKWRFLFVLESTVLFLYLTLIRFFNQRRWLWSFVCRDIRLQHHNNILVDYTHVHLCLKLLFQVYDQLLYNMQAWENQRQRKGQESNYREWTQDLLIYSEALLPSEPLNSLIDGRDPKTRDSLSTLNIYTANRRHY